MDRTQLASGGLITKPILYKFGDDPDGCFIPREPGTHAGLFAGIGDQVAAIATKHLPALQKLAEGSGVQTDSAPAGHLTREVAMPEQDAPVAVPVVLPAILTEDQRIAACVALGLPPLLVYGIEMGIHGTHVELPKYVTADGRVIASESPDGYTYVEREVRHIPHER